MSPSTGPSAPFLDESNAATNSLIQASAPPPEPADVEMSSSTRSISSMTLPSSAPSAPPPLTVLSHEEFLELTKKLKHGRGQLPSPSQLHTFRSFMCNRLLWVEQMRELAAVADGGPHMFQEAYERQLLANPQDLRADDGPWVQALWVGTGMPQASQAAQALLSQVAVTLFDGKTTMVSVDLELAKVSEVLEQAAQAFSCKGNFGDYSIFAVGAPDATTLGVGAFVKITGLMQNESLNGMVGQIVAQDHDQYDVVLPLGRYRLHKDSLVHYAANTVARNRGMQVMPHTSLKALGPAPRFLLLEANESTKAAALVGPLAAIKRQFFSMDVAGDNKIAVGEFRNFLWNLHLNDKDFKTVKQRFAPHGDYLDLEDILFLLGRPHLLSPDVPVDALIYEAVVSILGRRTTAHIDKDLSKEDKGIGCCNACSQHCPSYTTSLLLQGAVLGLVVCFILEERQEFGWSALGAYVLYLIHLACCVGLTKAFSNQTEGIENVLRLMDRPRHENLQYSWTIQCYHYETRVYTVSVSDGKGGTRTETRTRTERVNTHYASMSGVLPCTDYTPVFVPQTAAQQTQIDTSIDKDFSQSNYFTEYHRWCAFHRWDVHQDCNHSEELPSRAASCLAVWREGSLPCWINQGVYWLVNIFLLSFFYRLLVQSRLGRQDYVYVKKCHNIQTQCFPSSAGVGGALAAGAVVGALAAVGVAGMMR